MTTQIVSPSEEWLKKARDVILSCGVVAFHTETVYGLGANAFSDEAVQTIFSLKGRPADNPLIVHVHSAFDIGPLVDFIPDYTLKLAKAFLPGPLTMVYPSTGKVSKFVSCGLNTLAIRVPSSPVAQAFLRQVDLPIAAPSANRSKHVSPVTAKHVYDDFNGQIPFILDGGASEGGIESTVLDCTGEYPVILREGLVTREMIESVVGQCGVYKMRTDEKPKSPGMAYQHYAPKCKTAYYSAAESTKALERYREEEASGGKPCLLIESDLAAEFKGLNVLVLGGTGEEMANRLYAHLRQAEESATLLICVEPTLRGGVMAGVINRLTRAFGIQDSSSEEGK